MAEKVQAGFFHKSFSPRIKSSPVLGSMADADETDSEI
jgi:hypothetical protein